MASPMDEWILRFLGFEPVPEVFEATDGTLWKTPGAALLHDLIERKMAELEPVVRGMMRIGPVKKEWVQ